MPRPALSDPWLQPPHVTVWPGGRRWKCENRTTVVEFDFRGRCGRRLWLVLEPHEVSVCLRPPGFDPHLIVRADLVLVYRVWLGYIDYNVAVRSGGITVEGPATLAREFPRWLMWSPMAHHVRADQNRE